jgi:hypothetical protein
MPSPAAEAALDTTKDFVLDASALTNGLKNTRSAIGRKLTARTCWLASRAVGTGIQRGKIEDAYGPWPPGWLTRSRDGLGMSSGFDVLL